ncbi:MAG TPA: tyrosine-type recombinase/integrase, partial [Caulobacteraceae bacterium]
KKNHLPKLRPATCRDYEALIDDVILPAFKNVKVAEITNADVDSLHRKITRQGTGRGKGAPYRANRTVALLSKMFSYSIKPLGWRADNPAKGIERNAESMRKRYLSSDELGALINALAAYKDKQAANIVRLLILTGARRGEVLGARWPDFDLKAGVWTKPGATTKQKTDHIVPLSEEAVELVKAIRKAAGRDDEYLFPGRIEGHRVEIKHAWKELCVAAGIVTRTKAKSAKGEPITIIKPSARLHDLRHSYASYLASSGASLPLIGALLGHTQPATTARYAHLLDDAQRAATNQAAEFIKAARKPGAQIIPIEEGR